MRELRGRWALVTGAAGGIGRAISLALAERGMHLWLVDIDAARLRSVCTEVHERNVDARWLLADLSRMDEVDEVAETVLVSRSGVDVLVNNAGCACFGGTHHTSDELWDRLMAVNLHAPIRLTRRLLPHLRQRPEAHIVNMCSIAGLVAGGRFAAYHASKFGLVGFTQALRAEYTRKGLGVTAVCPGPVRTELYRNCETATGERVPEPPRWLSATPEQVAAATVRGILRNRRQVIITPLAHGLYQLNRFAPWLLDLAQTFSRKKLPWYRGKPLHVPTIFPVEDEPPPAGLVVSLPFVQDAPDDAGDLSPKRAA